ncbi:MAG TPA: zf-HC2 domain-containing protein [Pyrinomonadaceae bacterium]|nr:zf-HC2 domain-containing protein [Pyrinomonadaceae bacterium]
MSVDAIQEISCDEKLIAAYIDGELDASKRLVVDRHLDDCDHCREDLRMHRMFVCELDSVLAQSDVAVPVDFCRRVAARATSDLRGIRSPSENKKALAFCIGLALAALALLTDTSRLTALRTGRQVLRTIIGTVGVLLSAIYDMVASVTVIFRVLSRKLILESNSLGLLLVLFALAILLLSRMIVRYHRTGATE